MTPAIVFLLLGLAFSALSILQEDLYDLIRRRNLSPLLGYATYAGTFVLAILAGASFLIGLFLFFHHYPNP